MLTTEVGASARLLYNQSYISYDVSRNLLGTNLTVNRINSYFHFPIPLGKITDWILIKNNKKPFFDGIINDFNLYFGFSFTHDFINIFILKIYYPAACIPAFLCFRRCKLFNFSDKLILIQKFPPEFF